MSLSAGDFPAFFQEIHHTPPFPWQQRLMQQVAVTGRWPSVLDLPTGAGKTAAIDIAVFHLALQADQNSARRAPVRIAFVVDRRLVVDDAFTRADVLAKTLAKALQEPGRPITARVAERLQTLAGDGPPLIARPLRGGIPRESGWARTPSQPTVLCSTVDQVGSRLLFRGYGVTDSMKPVHAGLIGADCLILLDEAHLAAPFRQTLDWVCTYKGRNWRENEFAAPWGVALLTATPGEAAEDRHSRDEAAAKPFTLDDADRADPVLQRRLDAAKPARLYGPAITKARDKQAHETAEAADEGQADPKRRAAVIVEKVEAALRHFAAQGNPSPAIGIVLNRVARARAVHTHLERLFGKDEAVPATLLLLIGPARPVDRDGLAGNLSPIRTGAERTLPKPLIVVATQCIEAGVDIDLDGLITEVAPLDALRQRFGRLNRAGRAITPYAAIVAARGDFAKDDPVYGDAIKPSWDRLVAASTKAGGEQVVEFGIGAFKVEMAAEALSHKDNAPVLLPAHLDLLSQTSPVPDADPEVALYLHGPDRQPDSISVVWRADIDETLQSPDAIRRLLTFVPPRSGEAIELPLWAVRRWLLDEGDSQPALADAGSVVPDDDERRPRRGKSRRAFRWRGNDERSDWIEAGELHPGDAIVVPTAYGGIDAYGWNPTRRVRASDVAREAATSYEEGTGVKRHLGRSFAVRVAPGLVGDAIGDEALAEALSGSPSRSWGDLRAALQSLPLPEDIGTDLGRLDAANGKGRNVIPYLDLYGEDGEGRPRGVVFVAPFGIRVERKDDEEDGTANSTEDDEAGSTPGFSLSLAEHSADVEAKAGEFARSAGLPEDRVMDLTIAGWLHDTGKADPRFQAWLHYGDPLGPDLDEVGRILAKSDRLLPRSAHMRAGLPDYWRHEALSVRLAPHVVRFADAADPDLVLWLLGTHHGQGRPLFPHADPNDAKPSALPKVLDLPPQLPPGPGPQSLAFDWKGLDWPSLFVRLKERYGVWELARMEAILRLADHRASEKSAAKSTTAEGEQ